MEHINLFVCSMLWVWFQWSQWFHEVLLGDVYVNRSSAQQQCENYGGLFSYQTFLKETASGSLNQNYQMIHGGDSAWVSEFVNYSQFVLWQGCYLNPVLSDGTITYQMAGNSVFSCISLCNETKRLLYIGLYWDSVNEYKCYCFLKDSSNEILSVNSSGINKSIPDNKANIGSLIQGNMTLHICQNKLDTTPKINVYKLYDMEEIPYIESHGQCVYAIKVTKEETMFIVKYGTRSCFSHGEESQNGLICVGTGSDTLGDMACRNSNPIHKTHCIMNASTDWYQARSKCMTLNGILVGAISDEIEKHMETNVTYWTGIFRDYEIIHSSSEMSEGDLCLSVRNISFEFVLEPAQCSDEKLKLCQGEYSSSEFTFEANLKISLIFNGVLLLVIVCMALVLYRRRRNTAPSLYRLTCEKATTTTRSNDTLADDSVFYAVDSDEYRDDSHYYSCPNKTATETGSRDKKYDHSHDSVAKQYDHICLRNASNKHVGHSDNINVPDYSHINASQQHVRHDDNINVSDYSHINASHQHVGHGNNINVSDYSHLNALAKATASNQTIYEEIREQALYRKTETEV